jgi:hypothetical protein
VRTLGLIAVVAGCSAPAVAIDAAQIDAAPPDAAPPPVALALVPTDRGIDFTPMRYAATAPRGTRVILRVDVYRHHERDDRTALAVEYVFDHDGTVPLTVFMGWGDADRFRSYTLDIAGTRDSVVVTNPRHPVAVFDRTSWTGADPATAGIDYPVFAWLSDPHQAGGYIDLADGIPLHDFGVVISARFELPARR